jgi:hypothetical protein
MDGIRIMNTNLNPVRRHFERLKKAVINLNPYSSLHNSTLLQELSIMGRTYPLLGRDLKKDNQYSRCYAIGR